MQFNSQCMHLIATTKAEQLPMARYNTCYSKLLPRKYSFKKDIFILKAYMSTFKSLRYLMSQWQKHDISAVNSLE